MNLLNNARTLATLVVRPVLVSMNCMKILVSIQGNLYVDTEEKLCNKETELLGTLKASITTTQYLSENMVQV